MRPRLAIAIALVVPLALLAACTFDPLAGWEAPRFGNVTVGDAVTPGDDAALADVPPPPPPLAIDAVDPERGEPTGDELVVIHGTGFESGVEVWFGDVAGVFPQAQQGERIFVRTPPHPPAIVDIRVVLPDGREAVKQDAFLFGRPVRLHDIEPVSGPAAGGTPVTVRGEGFLDDTVVVISGRRLVEQRLVDDGTVIGITAGAMSPDIDGAVDVVVANQVGSARLKRAFTYEAPVTLRGVEPFTGPASGGQVVTLRGTGLGGLTQDAVVLFDDTPATVVDWGADGTSLGVVVPAGPEGAVDVEVIVPDRGGARLADGYVRHRDDVTSGTLFAGGLWPSAGDAAGGELVSIALSGLPEDAAAPVVLFAGERADTVSHTPSAGLVIVRTPAGQPGTVDVVVQAAGRSLFLPRAYTYRATFAVTSVTPATGSTGGGTAVTVGGVGLDADTRVWFGPLPATAVRAGANGTLTATTPPGAPGSVALRVERGDRRARLDDAFTYTWGEIALFAMQPDRGAIAGGTWVELYGADFPEGASVRFGNRMARDVVRLSPSRLGAYTPAAADPGSVDVAVLAGAQTSVREHGFTYFDPRGTDPGTWGGPIDGAVNVTVLKNRPVEPVPNAFVMLGDDPRTSFRAWTDENGQATLSGPGLAGVRDVTATAVGYTASTIIAVDAENVVLTLVPDIPPANGGGGGVTLPNGAVAGRVEGAVKYVPVPRAPCDEKLDAFAPLCHPCATDEDCVDPNGTLEDPECTDLGLEGLRCTSGCNEALCPIGYACSPLDGRPRCVPTLGMRNAHCEITRRSPYWYAETDPSDVDTTGRYYLESRLGEVAVVCLGGYEDWDTGEFVPTRMGVKRHVFAESASILDSQDIALDIPLTRTVVFRLDPTRPPDGEPWDTRVSVYLDFGPDGVYPLGEELGATESGDVHLLRVPASFTGALFDAGLTLYAGRYTPDDLTDTPYSATFREGLDDEDLARPHVLTEVLPTDEGAPDEGAGPHWAFDEPVFPRQPYAVWQAPDGVRFVGGEEGQLVRHTPGIGWTVQPALGNATIRDIDGVDRSSVWAVGDGGAVFHHDGLTWRRMEPVTDRDLRAVWAPGPERFIAVGDHRIVEYDRGAWTEHKVGVDLYGVSGHHWERVWAVGRDGALLVRTADGWDRVTSPTDADLYGVWLAGDSTTGFAVGARGTALRLDDGAWEPVDLGIGLGTGLAPDGALFDVHGRDPYDVTVVGDDGVVLRHDGRTWRREPTGAPEMAIRSVHAAAGEAGSWTAVGPRAVPLGPILPVLRFEEPAVGAPWSGLHFRWTLGPGPEAGAVFVDVIGQTGGTRWTVLAPGHVRGFDLPDLVLAAGFTPVPPGTLRLRAQSAFWPTFDINNVRSSRVTYAEWISWTYHYLVLE